MLETIVVADDGSDGAAKAIEVASDFAAKSGGKISIVHAVQPELLSDDLLGLAETEHLVPSDSDAGPAGGHAVLVATRGIDRGQRRQMAAEALGRQILNRAEATARGKGVNEVSTKLAEGDPAQEILAHAAAVSADMVVTGARGLGALKGLFIGSVSHKVVNLAPCICMVVK